MFSSVGRCACGITVPLCIGDVCGCGEMCALVYLCMYVLGCMGDVRVGGVGVGISLILKNNDDLSLSICADSCNPHGSPRY